MEAFHKATPAHADVFRRVYRAIGNIQASALPYEAQVDAIQALCDVALHLRPAVHAAMAARLARDGKP